MSRKIPHTTPRGRDAGNGQFIPVKKAVKRKDAEVEQVPNPGYGRKK